MVTVMGATGHTGNRIVRTLLKEGEKVRALGRSENKLADARNAGAEIRAGDAADPKFLTEAFRSSDAVYTLIPPDAHSDNYRAKQDTAGEAIVKAIRDSGVRYAVFLSSIGADLEAGTGPIAGLHAQEERLRKLKDVHVLILRAGFFFENFYEMLGLIKQQGINGGAVAPDVPVPMIATRDIADAAAKALKARNWNGVVVRELLGQRDLTQLEATRILGEQIGKPGLRYVQFPYADFTAALVQMGVSQNVAGLYTEMAGALNNRKVKSLEGRRPENTTPTRFEDFAAELAHVFKAA